MELLKGTIAFNSGDTKVMCALGVFHRGRAKSWRGYLIMSEQSSTHPIAEGDVYRLALEDGRYGDLSVTKIRRDRKGVSMVDFEGAGELTSPELEEDYPAPSER